MTLKFEVGKKYITRNGTVVVCLDTEAPGKYPIIWRNIEPTIFSGYKLVVVGYCDLSGEVIHQQDNKGAKIISEYREPRVLWLVVDENKNIVSARNFLREDLLEGWTQFKAVEVFEE